jgi:hypothetical protein
MAEVLVYRAASPAAALAYGRLAIAAGKLYFGNASNLPIEVANADHTHATLYTRTQIGEITAIDGYVATTIFAATYQYFEIEVTVLYNTSYSARIVFRFVPAHVPYTGGAAYQIAKFIIPLYHGDLTSNISYQKPLVFSQSTSGQIKAQWNTTTTYGQITSVKFYGITC